MLFDNGSIFSSFQKTFIFLGWHSSLFLLVESFWRFYKRQIFQYKSDTTPVAKTELEIVLATLFDGEVFVVLIR
jgi:hypothetical protein